MITKKILWDVIEDGNNYRPFLRLDQSQGPYLLELFKSNVSLIDSWHSIDLVLSQEKGDEDKPIGDFMSGFVSVALNKKALLILDAYLSDQVEYLPLKTDVGLYYALNVKQIDCLDKSRSIVKLFSSSKKIMRVEKYAFKWEKLVGIDIFRVPELGISRLFVSDTFKCIVEENNLTGLLFYPVPLVETTFNTAL